MNYISLGLCPSYSKNFLKNSFTDTDFAAVLSLKKLSISFSFDFFNISLGLSYSMKITFQPNFIRSTTSSLPKNSYIFHTFSVLFLFNSLNYKIIFKDHMNKMVELESCNHLIMILIPLYIWFYIHILSFISPFHPLVLVKICGLHSITKPLTLRNLYDLVFININI